MAQQRDQFQLKSLSLLSFLLFSLCCGSTFDLRERLATKSPYWTTYEPADTPVPEGCQATPSFFNYLARHGSRDPTGGDAKKLYALQNLLNQNGDYITNSSFSWLQNWKSPFNIHDEGYLNVYGEEEHYNTSKRWISRLSPLLSQSWTTNQYPINTTQVPRTARSGNSFGFALTEGHGYIGASQYEPFFTISDTKSNDILLRFFDNCPTYQDLTTLDDQADLYHNKNVPSVVSRIQSLLGINPAHWQLDSSTIDVLYTACCFDVSQRNDTDHFCTLFTEEDILMFEYYEDLSNYYEKGYGTPLSYQIAAPLLQNFFGIMNNFIAGKTFEQSAALRFAHAETILPFVSLLGLFAGDPPLTWNLATYDIINRKFRSSIISPFAANVAFVLYNCTGSSSPWRVKLLHNEIEYEFPGENGQGCGGEMYCPIDTLQSMYQTALQFNYAKSCGLNPPSPPPQPQIVEVFNGVPVSLAVGLVFVGFLIGAVVASAITIAFFKRKSLRWGYHKVNEFEK